MGEPVNIAELAKQLIELSGLKLDKDIKIVYTGLRPGEKLHECLYYEGEEEATEIPHLLELKSKAISDNNYIVQIQNLLAKLYTLDHKGLCAEIKKLVPEYQMGNDKIT
jgi:FlaA1/EpsC-like NDP-sugar epimerase